MAVVFVVKVSIFGVVVSVSVFVVIVCVVFDVVVIFFNGFFVCKPHRQQHHYSLLQQHRHQWI